MYEYLHKVQYYETDQMRVAHHSNYIRWMEEARLDYLAAIGVDYAALEREGFVSPVVDVSCRYRAMTRFGETVRIRVRLKELTTARYALEYLMEDAATGELRAAGESSHCFISPKGLVLPLRRVGQGLFDRLAREMETT